MARSKHTDPRRIRAARRLRAPYAPRRAGDPHRAHALARALKLAGCLPSAWAAPPDRADAPLPPVHVRRPRAGYLHPANKADVVALLRFFGAPCTYGLRAVELIPGPAGAAPGRHPLGRLHAPGTVRLYDQPPSPWCLPGRLPENEQARLRRAGALVDEWGDGTLTVVSWPGTTLRDFILFDVLMHEIGHHLVQQYKGKRPARLIRTRDHEAFADRFAQRCRDFYYRARELAH